MIKASIIITCYNKERYITRAINSCLNQNFPEGQYEIIIVADPSTDKSRHAISLYRGGGEGGRINLLPTNKGPAHASKVGDKRAREKYIVRVDDNYLIRPLRKIL